jgi:hypothetical protein
MAARARLTEGERALVLDHLASNAKDAAGRP